MDLNIAKIIMQSCCLAQLQNLPTFPSSLHTAHAMSIYSEMHPLYYTAHPVQAIQAVITQSSKYKFEPGNELQKICFILWKEMWNFVKSSCGI